VLERQDPESYEKTESETLRLRAHIQTPGARGTVVHDFHSKQSSNPRRYWNVDGTRGLFADAQNDRSKTLPFGKSVERPF